MSSNKLNYLAPINNSTGYGITSTNILKALDHKDLSRNNVTVFPLGNIAVDNAKDQQWLNSLLEKTNKGWDKKAPCLKVWHPHDLALSVGRGKYGALVFFELDTLKPMEKVHCNQVDVLFVASKWAKKVVEDSGVTVPVVVAPLAVDTNVFKDHEHPKVLTKDTYKFLNIGKWEVRKGHDFLLEAFNEAFEVDDDVELIMVNQNPFLTQQENAIWANMYQNSKLGKAGKIQCIGRLPTHIELAKLIRDCDCGFFPARAEGWNNEILEVMALNKPVITTNYSAHTEYCTTDNAHLIEVTNLVIAEDGKFFNGEGKWADLGQEQKDQAVEHLRKVYKDNIKTNPAGLSTASKYTWSHTAEIIKTEMFKDV